MEPKFTRVLFLDKPVFGVCLEFIVVNIFDLKTTRLTPTSGLLETGFMDPSAWEKTKETKVVHLWSINTQQLKPRENMRVISCTFGGKNGCDNRIVNFAVTVDG
jgi:phosphoribosyl-AMP cyclohydrolase